MDDRSVGGGPVATQRVAGALLGAALLVALALGGIARTADLLEASDRAVLDARDAAYVCLEGRVVAAVPPSSRVYFTTDRRQDPVGEWTQRAIEGSYPKVHAVTSLHDAEYVVALGAVHDGCPLVRATSVQ